MRELTIRMANTIVARIWLPDVPILLEETGGVDVDCRADLDVEELDHEERIQRDMDPDELEDILHEWDIIQEAADAAKQGDTMAEASFKNGKKHNHDGRVCDPVKLKEPMSSNGHTKYCTVLWDDGTYSCNCPGWSFKRGPGDRKCKHTKEALKCGGSDMTPIENFVSESGAPERRGQVIIPAKREHRGIKITPKS